MTSFLLWMALQGGAASAVDVGWRSVDVDYLAGGARDVDEDPQGFLWFASERGLVRFDGERARLVEPEGQRLSTWYVATALGTVYAATRAGMLYVMEGGVLAPVLGPDGVHVRSRSFDGSPDELWVFSAGRLLRRRPGADWEDLTPPGLRDVRGVYHVRAQADGSALVASHLGLWRVLATGESEQLREGLTVDAAVLSDGRLVLYGDGTWLMDGDEVTLLLEHQGTRAMFLVVRDDVVYMVYDVVMFRITPDDGQVQRVTRSHSGGPPLRGDGLAASDGSLWISNVLLPEPDTVTWGSHDGVSGSGRWVTTGPDGVLHYSSWGEGFQRLQPTGALVPPAHTKGRAHMVCVDRVGRALTFFHNRDGRGVMDMNIGEYVVPDVSGTDCAPSSAGGVWMTADGELLEVDGDEIRRFKTNPAVSRGVTETADGLLVLAGGTTVCEARVEAVRAGDEDAWTCTDLGEIVGPNITCAIEAKPGLVWLCTEGDGVWERRGLGEWGPSQVNDVLEVRSAARAEPSASGGVWLRQGRDAARVVHENDAWRVAEHLGPQVGLYSFVGDVDEDEHGNVWVAGAGGVSRVLAHRRAINIPSFPPRFVAALVDGEQASAPIMVPSGSTAELQFAALAYRYSTTLRYRWRAGSGAWSSPSSSGTIRLAGLASGDVQLEVATTVDGVTWSDPVAVTMSVLPAWYERWWVWALAAAAVGLLLLGIQRLRARVAIEAESQRARIAMDLHDELGAGLGSIAILAGLLTSDRVPVARARDAAKRIAADAEELGGSVTDIVWSLRSRNHDLSTLVTYLRDRAQGLLDLEVVRLRSDLPDPMPRVVLPPPVARAAQLIMVEALYNAARHSEATEVVIGLRSVAGAWCLVVSDNGVGIELGPATRNGGGTGSVSMQRRAADVGATLEVESAPGQGTEVRLELPG